MNKAKQTTATLSSRIQTLFEEAQIKLVDIGARGEDMTHLGSLSGIKWLVPFANYYACEPDGMEAAALRARYMTSQWKSVTVFEEALASEEGRRSLYVTASPGSSSLLKPNASVADRYYSAEGFQLVRAVDVNVIPLDHAAAKHGFLDACLLKLDTQGTELDILKSGERLVTDSAIVVHVEVEFQEFYERQPLFCDVDAWLRAKGFSIFDLDRAMLRRKAFHQDLYSKRELVWGHALYFKSVDEIVRSCSGTEYRHLLRLVSLALALEYYDFTVQLLEDPRVMDRCRGFLTPETVEDIRKFMRSETVRIVARGANKAILKAVRNDRKSA